MILIIHCGEKEDESATKLGLPFSLCRRLDLPALRLQKPPCQKDQVGDQSGQFIWLSGRNILHISEIYVLEMLFVQNEDDAEAYGVFF